jgi:hypothetical protein
VTRHEVFIGIIGAFIVFIGFFVKEGVREQSKDFAQAIEEAQANFEINEQLNQGFVELANRATHSQTVIDQKLTSSNPILRPADRQQIAERMDEDRENLYEFQRTISSYRFSFARADKLLHLLPSKGTQLASEENLLQGLFTKVAALEISTNKLNVFDSNDTIEKETQSFELFDYAVVEIANVQWTVDGYLSDFKEQVLIKAQKEQEVAETRKRRATTLSYCLFGVGWTLGLLGRILRIPGLDSGNE